MTPYLTIQNTYNSMQIGIYKDMHQCAFIELDKTLASKECIVAIKKLLAECNLTLNDLLFIAANQGPGPFTTLRVVIATINGISFATQIPLIGINSIEAFLKEYEQKPYENMVVILNAFGGDLYYGIQIKNSYLDIGCASIASVLLEIKQKMPSGPILLMGNGIVRGEKEIQELLGNRVLILNPNPETVSLNQIAQIGLEKWLKKQDLNLQLQPFYFKQAF